MAMLYDLASKHSTREVWWIHTTRNAEMHAFADEARQLLGSLPNAHAHVFYTAPTGPAETPDITAGRLTESALAQLELPIDATAYICGPDAFMSNIRDALVALGVDANQVHSELFGAQAAINPGIVGETRKHPHPPSGPPGTGAEVTFARAGLAVPWSDDYGSVLELAEACDVPTRWSCRTGVCHTCVTPVVSGEATYVIQPLELPAPGELLLCCSVPATDLVIDL
jgi:ferredoxin